MKLSYLLPLLLLFSCLPGIGFAKNATDPIPNTSYGKIVRLANFQSAYVESRHVDIWLPDGYTEEQRYPVLYMHDGQMLFDSTHTWNGLEWGLDEVLGEQIQAQNIPSVIVVGIWHTNAGRHGDYFPAKALNYLPKPFRDSVTQVFEQSPELAHYEEPFRADAYLQFLTKELKPYIDTHFATKPQQPTTFIAGSSMGGLISLYALCEYPEVFSAAACISTHWEGFVPHEGNPTPKAFRDYLSDHLPAPGNHRLYFDFGTETLDATYEPQQQVIDSVMQAAGYGSHNWLTRKFEGHLHSEVSWHQRLHIPLTFLLAKP